MLITLIGNIKINMTTTEFCYWLQGFMETADPKSINETQTQIIKDHLDLVFNKVTPDRKEVKENKEEKLEKDNNLLWDYLQKHQFKMPSSFPPQPELYPDFINFPPNTIIC